MWRIRLDGERTGESWTVLSREEQERASRFHFEIHRRSYIVAHGWLRRILAGYLDARAEELTFVTGEFGKPSLLRASGADALEFNLSHSGDIALVAVTVGRHVGVDVERWNAEIEHMDLADQFFSVEERRALRALAGDTLRVTSAFFAAWSRKEAYLKASGHGIARGLHHFNVSLEPGEPARLIADQLDVAATDRWAMRTLAVGEGYSAALVVAAPVTDVLLFDAIEP